MLCEPSGLSVPSRSSEARAGPTVSQPSAWGWDAGTHLFKPLASELI